MRPIIVGFDPGATVGLAVINTNGEILFLTSKNNLKKGDIINHITQYGKAIIVASDRRPLPKNVDKLAKSLGAKTFYPFESLGTLEKWNLVREYDIKVKNDHERDALAAALKAYKSYSSMFRKTRTALSSLGLTELYPEVLNKIIFGEAENINEAIETVLDERREKKPKEIIVKETSSKDKELLKTIERLQEELKRREKDILVIKKFNEKLKKEKMILEEQLYRYQEKKPKRNERLEREIFDKDETIKKLKAYRLLERRGLLPVIELIEAKSDNIELLDNLLGLKDRVILLGSSKNIHLLNGYEIKAVVLRGEINEEVLRKVDFSIINEKDISIQEVDGYKVVDEKVFDEKLKHAKKTGLIQWIQGYKKRKY